MRPTRRQVRVDMPSESFTELTAPLLRDRPLPAPGHDKEARGRVLVIGGSRSIPGAARLAGEAALRSGAGKLQIATATSIAPGLALALPEAMVLPMPEGHDGEILRPDPAPQPLLGQCDALLLGPGMQRSQFLLRLANEVAQQSGAALVLDAGALDNRLVAPAGRPFVLTPHAGEMAELCEVARDEVEAAPLECSLRLAEKMASVVVLKGSDTYVVEPGGNAWLHRGGVPGLATSGSGDVLAGLIAGLAARGASAVEAALWGVWAHAQAGRRLSATVGTLGFLAREIAAQVPGILDQLQVAAPIGPRRADRIGRRTG